MKKIIIASSFVLCLIFCVSCAEKPIEINIRDLADNLMGSFDLANTVEYDESMIQTYYGIGNKDVKQIIVLKELDVNSAEVIILLEAIDKDKAKEIENNLKENKTYKLNELKDYTANPDNERQYYIVEKSEIVVKQNYVFWAVNDKTKEINDAIDEYINNNNK